MATQSKTQLLTNIHTLLKRRYKPKADPNASRLSVLKAVVYGICHEDTTREQANQALSRFKDEFFDWNEIRVSSVEEIQETLAGIPDPESRAQRIRRFLRQLFNRTYGFTLDALAKKPLKEALKVLQTYDAFASDYVTATVIQQALGGHAIPVDKAAHRVLRAGGDFRAGGPRSAGDPGASRPQEPGCRVPRLDRRPRQRHLPGNRPGMSPLRAAQSLRIRSDCRSRRPIPWLTPLARRSAKAAKDATKASKGKDTEAERTEPRQEEFRCQAAQSGASSLQAATRQAPRRQVGHRAVVRVQPDETRGVQDRGGPQRVYLLPLEPLSFEISLRNCSLSLLPR